MSFLKLASRALISQWTHSRLGLKHAQRAFIDIRLRHINQHGGSVVLSLVIVIVSIVAIVVVNTSPDLSSN